MTCTDICCRPYDDDGSCVLIGTKRQKSRTKRTCSRCGEPLEAGSVYDRVAYKVDGDMVTYAQHTFC